MTKKQKLFLSDINEELEKIQVLFDKFELDIQFKIKPKEEVEYDSYHWTFSNY